jgi:hypothetical protein
MSVLPTKPTLEGYVQFCQTVVGIPTAVLPSDSIQYSISYEIALELVPYEYMVQMSPQIATLCVYYWGASVLINYGVDNPNAEPPNNTFFADARKGYGVNNFVAGVITSASDQGTSESMAVGQGLQNLTLTDLERMKDPYGRQALAWMQSIGTLWGLS